MNEAARFIDNGDGTITDNETGLVWCQQDSWTIAQDWLTFQEALGFVDEMNKKDFLGHHDWRMPEKEEIEKLYVPEVSIMARSSQEIHLDRQHNLLQERRSTEQWRGTVSIERQWRLLEYQGCCRGWWVQHQGFRRVEY